MISHAALLTTVAILLSAIIASCRLTQEERYRYLTAPSNHKSSSTTRRNQNSHMKRTSSRSSSKESSSGFPDENFQKTRRLKKPHLTTKNRKMYKNFIFSVKMELFR
jgi:BRCT domain type II-containing protein